MDEAAQDDAGLRGAHDDADDEEGAHDDASEDGEDAPAPSEPPPEVLRDQPRPTAPSEPPPEVLRDHPRPPVLTTAPSRLVDVSIAALAELPPADQIVALVMSSAVLSSAAASNAAVTPSERRDERTPWERLAIATATTPNMSTVRSPLIAC